MLFLLYCCCFFCMFRVFGFSLCFYVFLFFFVCTLLRFFCALGTFPVPSLYLPRTFPIPLPVPLANFPFFPTLFVKMMQTL